MTPQRTVPNPSPFRALHHVRRFLANRAQFLHDIWREYGDVCRFRLGLFDVYLVNRPEVVKEVFMRHDDFPKTPATRFLGIVLGNGLLLSEGETHKRQRRLMQPLFHKKRIVSYADAMAEYAARMAEQWRDKPEIDVGAEMTRLTMDIVGKTLFNLDANDSSGDVSKAVGVVMPFVDRIADPLGALRMKLPSAANRRFNRARRDLDAFVYRMIAERRDSGEDKGDLLSMLLMAQDEEGDGTGMTDQQVRDEALTLYLAGYETTAVALTWTWYALAQHRDVEARLHEELERELDGRVPTFDDIPKLAYTRMVISEVMRLYPPAYLVDRLTGVPLEAGEYLIPRGKYVFTSPYVMHRHPEFYPDPERFDPERWTPEEIAKRPKFAYFPFGGGPRTCIGEHFAWTEMVLVVATLAQRYTMTLDPRASDETRPLVTLRPKHPIRVRLAARREGLAVAAMN